MLMIYITLGINKLITATIFSTFISSISYQSVFSPINIRSSDIRIVCLYLSIFHLQIFQYVHPALVRIVEQKTICDFVRQLVKDERLLKYVTSTVLLISDAEDLVLNNRCCVPEEDKVAGKLVHLAFYPYYTDNNAPIPSLVFV